MFTNVAKTGTSLKYAAKRSGTSFFPTCVISLYKKRLNAVTVSSRSLAKMVLIPLKLALF